MFLAPSFSSLSELFLMLVQILSVDDCRFSGFVYKAVLSLALCLSFLSELCLNAISPPRRRLEMHAKMLSVDDVTYVYDDVTYVYDKERLEMHAKMLSVDDCKLFYWAILFLEPLFVHLQSVTYRALFEIHEAATMARRKCCVFAQMLSINNYTILYLRVRRGGLRAGIQGLDFCDSARGCAGARTRAPASLCTLVCAT